MVGFPTAPSGPEPRRPVVADASVAGHRRGLGSGGFLRSVRTQLLVPIVVATAGLIVLGTIQTATAAAAARDASRAQVLATTATGTVRLVHEIERESAETVALRQRGGKLGLILVTAQRQRTDAAATRYRRASQAARRSAPPLAKVLGAAGAALDSLEAARRDAPIGGAAAEAGDQTYRAIASALLAVADALPGQLADPLLASGARAVAAVANIEHLHALERDALYVVFTKGRFDPGGLPAVATLIGGREQREAEFTRSASSDVLAVYTSLMRGLDVDAAQKMRAGVLNSDRDPAALDADQEAWYTAQSNVIRRVNLVSLQLSERLDRTAARVALSAERRAWFTGVGTAVLAILVLTAAILLAVRTSRRLRRLRAAALTVARRELPEAIQAVTTNMPPRAETGPSAAAVTRSIAATNDEIGQVADAFGSVHRTALRLAAEQAEVRVDVARMAETLARRIRTLITRQLRLLDEFEREETDPDALGRLFALDHLAARLRRNGENLLVLAGGEPGRPVTESVPLAMVVTAAASEIEDFHRVHATIGQVAIAGRAVGDLVHLLAELLENAATYSPPESAVYVEARATVHGATVQVHDSGIGIAANRLAELNGRLVRPGTLTSAAAGTMGLNVVAHLARRHGIVVRLHATGTGTVAYVELPHDALAPFAAAVTGGAPPRSEEIADAPLRPTLTAGPNRGPADRDAADVSAAATAARAANAGAPVVGAFARAGDGVTAQPQLGATVTWFPQRPGAPLPERPAPPLPIPGPRRPAVSEGGFADAAAAAAAFPNGGLPRRRPGAELAPVTAPAGPPSRIDPDSVRARLSSFAEGAAAAARRRDHTSGS